MPCSLFLLHVACYTSHVACYTSHAACYTSHATCYTSHAACNMHVTCILYVACYTCCLLHVAWSVSVAVTPGLSTCRCWASRRRVCRVSPLQRSSLTLASSTSLKSCRTHQWSVSLAAAAVQPLNKGHFGIMHFLLRGGYPRRLSVIKWAYRVHSESQLVKHCIACANVCFIACASLSGCEEKSGQYCGGQTDPGCSCGQFP